MASKLHAKVQEYLAKSGDASIPLAETNSHNSYLELIFDRFWSDRKIRKIINLPSVDKLLKKDQVSGQFRTEGNRLYSEKKYDKALAAYNYAVICAPVDKDRSLNETLALAYANRSAVLFQIGQFHHSIQEIDRSIKNGYPKSKLTKLRQRHIQCNTNIKELKDSQNSEQKTESGISFFRGSEKPDILNEISTDCSFMSKSITKHFTKEKGRHLVATRDIKPGEILVKEKAFCSVPVQNSEMLRNYCCICLRTSFLPLPCGLCSLVVFCSEKCQEKMIIHEKQCSVLPTVVALNLDEEVLLVFRTLCSFKKEQIIRFKQNKTTNTSSDKLTIIDTLEGNIGLRSEQSLKEAAINSVIVMKLLQNVPHFNSAEDSSNDIILGGVIFEWILNFQCNIHMIKELQVDKSINIISCDMKTVGYGVYDILSLVNHSCSPNALHSSWGDYKFLYSVAPIAKGEEIVDSYGERFITHEKAARKRSLNDTYYFDCHCQACRNNWPLYANLPVKFSLICTRCRKPIDQVLRKCNYCKLNYDHSSTSKFKKSSLDYQSMDNQVSRDWKIYNDRAYTDLNEHKASLSNIRDAISPLICSFNELTNVPHMPMIEAQEVLLRTFDLLGSCVFVNQEIKN